MPLDLSPVWQSFVAFLRHGEPTFSGAAEWVRVHHWRESPAGMALLTDVFTELAHEHARLTSKAQPAPGGPSD